MTEAEAYTVLAKVLQSVCPADFLEARITAELEPDWSEKRYQVRVNDAWSKGLSVDPALDFDADDALHALYKLFRAEGRVAWSHCTFTLKPDGEFDFDVKENS